MNRCQILRPLNLRRWVYTLMTVGILSAIPVQAANLDAVTQLIQSGKPKAALEALEPILKAEPKDAQARFVKGILLTELDRVPEAIQTFNALAQDHPELPEPHNNLAVLYAAQGRFDEAKKSLELSIRTNPSYAVAHENLGDLYAKLASMAYDQALQIDQANRSVATKLQLLREIFLPVAPAAPAASSASPAAHSRPASTEPAQKAEKPAPVAKAQAPKEAIAAMLNGWATAWSRKDVDAYLAFYDTDFAPAHGLSREDWATQRRERLTKPASIEVAFDQLKVTLDNDKTPGKARLKFRQRYHADHLKTRDYKVMELVLRDGQWKILREK